MQIFLSTTLSLKFKVQQHTKNTSNMWQVALGWDDIGYSNISMFESFRLLFAKKNAIKLELFPFYNRYTVHEKRSSTNLTVG